MITALFFIVQIVQPAWAKPLKFAVLSDIHYSIDKAGETFKMYALVRKNLPKILRDLNRDDTIDFIVFTGDLFVDPYYPELSQLKEIISSNFSKPWFVIPGNHDRITYIQRKKGIKAFSLDDFVKTFKGHPYPDAKRSYWGLDFKGYRLIGLDSTKDDPLGGRVSKKQLSWLKKELHQNKDKFTIVFSHHSLNRFYPEVSLEREYLADNYKEVRKLLSQNSQVKFVVVGHYHFSAVNQNKGLYFFSMPSIMTYPCRYAVFSVDQDRVKYQTINTVNNRALLRAKKGLISDKYWRSKFISDEALTGLFEGVGSFEFGIR